MSLKNFQKALNHITRKIPKKYSPNFLIRKNPGIKTFELKKILRSSLHLKLGVSPCGPTSIIILFLTIPISIRRKCSGSRKTAWIFHQILSTNSLRKCQENNVENLCVNIRVFRVEMDIDGTGNIVSALNRGWRHWDSDRRMVEPTFSVQVNYCKTSFFTELSINRKLALFTNCSFTCTFAFFFFILPKNCWFKMHAGLFLCGNKTLLYSFFIIPEKP